MVLGVYLTVVLVLYVITLGNRSARAGATALRMTTPGMRRFVEVVVGVSLAVSNVASVTLASALASALPAGARASDSDLAGPVDRRLPMSPGERGPDERDSSEPGTEDDRPDPPIEVMTVVDPADGAVGTAGEPVGDAARGPRVLEPAGTARVVGAVAANDPIDGSIDRPTDQPPAESSSSEVWEVGRGDHLWGIAEQTLVAAWGSEPSDRETAGYWTELVAHNRDRLADRANPDLIFPGQIIELLPVPARMPA
jgi:hypothetical protein